MDTYEDRIRRLTDLPKTRSEAIKLGVKQYFTRVPCTKGHISARTTSTDRCVQCGNYYANEYQHKSKILKDNTNSSANRKRIDELKDTGEYKEVWEE